MKKIELIVLKLRDFKGIKSQDIQLDGGNAQIFGDNEVGKTTTLMGSYGCYSIKTATTKRTLLSKR